MNKERTIEYFQKGNRFFIVLSIDTIRDGGSKVIKTSKGNYYIDIKKENFYSNYPLIKKNMITDPLVIEYIIERMDSYIKKEEENIKRNKEMISVIKNKQ